MTARDINAWLAYIETLHHQPIDPGLERIRIVAKQLNFLPFKCPVITVAGTNGKGSSVALLENILLAQGYRVGCYTSPHLISYNERVRINGKNIDDISLCEVFSVIEQARAHISLSFFEFGTLAALLLFKQANLDAVILEVGMGGRLDAVNIVDADLAIISTIALDHMEWLGDDREKIGYEKAGIMRANKPAVCGDFAVPLTIRNHARAINTQLYCMSDDFAYEKTSSYTWSWWSARQKLMDLPVPSIELQNAATVLKAIELLSEQLNISRAAIEQGLKQVNLLGRFQNIVNKGVQTILDVAHNPAAAEWLANKLQETPCTGRTLAVIAMLSDKDQLGMVTHLLPQIAVWHTAGLTVPRGGFAVSLAKHLRLLGALEVYEHATVALAYRTAQAEARAGDRIIVFGSFYTVAEVLQLRI